MYSRIKNAGLLMLFLALFVPLCLAAEEKKPAGLGQATRVDTTATSVGAKSDEGIITSGSSAPWMWESNQSPSLRNRRRFSRLMKALAAECTAGGPGSTSCSYGSCSVPEGKCGSGEYPCCSADGCGCSSAAMF